MATKKKQKKEYAVKVYCEMKCWDSGILRVMATDEKQAQRIAMRRVRQADRDGEIDWNPAESDTFESTGRYDHGDAHEDDGED